MIVSKAKALNADGTLKDGFTFVEAKNGRTLYMTCTTPECQLKHNTRLNQKIKAEKKPKKKKITLTEKDVAEAIEANEKMRIKEEKRALKKAMKKEEWITIGGKKKETTGALTKTKPPRPTTLPVYPSYKQLTPRPEYEAIDTASMYLPRDKPSKRYLKSEAKKAETARKVKPPKKTNKKSLLSSVDKPLPSTQQGMMKEAYYESINPSFTKESPLYKSKATIKKRKGYAKAIKTIKKLDTQKATKSVYSKTKKDEKSIRKLLGL
jgi:hypothetical protein